jgi:site-specific recombinase XerD
MKEPNTSCPGREKRCFSGVTTLKAKERCSRSVTRSHKKVFSRINGDPIQRFNSAWRTVCKIAGFKNLHFHDLRHTFCSNLLLSGADIKRVKEMIGHKDLSMTDRYTHLTLKHKSLCQERLAAHYAQTE